MRERDGVDALRFTRVAAAQAERAEPEVRLAAIIRRLRIARLDGECPRIGVERLVVFPELALRIAETVPRLGKIRIRLRRLLTETGTPTSKPSASRTSTTDPSTNFGTTSRTSRRRHRPGRP